MCLPMSDFMRHIFVTSGTALLLAVAAPVFAQDSQPQTPPETEQQVKPDELPAPDALPEAIPLDQLERLDGPDAIFESDDAVEGIAGTEPAIIEKPDYSRLTEAEEREVRLDALFERLQAEDNAEAANLIAEEIWAIWLDSGSASVNLLLRRGTAAQKRGDDNLARRMFNHVIELSPDYAEGWARSARLAYEEEDLSRALTEVTQALILEPRQFYAHWTLGNIFEKIGRTEEAYETYKEANRLYPELMPVKDRLEMMKGSIEGDVL